MKAPVSGVFRIVRSSLVLTISTVLLIVPCAPLAAHGEGWIWQIRNQGGGGRPEDNVMATGLPDLEEIKNQSPAPQTPPALASTVRSRHNPAVLRNGRRVGDPWSDDSSATPPRRASSNRARHPARWARTMTHHARRLLTPPPVLYDDQYVQSLSVGSIAAA